MVDVLAPGCCCASSVLMPDVLAPDTAAIKWRLLLPRRGRRYSTST